MTIAESLQGKSDIPGMAHWPTGVVREWSRICGRFLEWERQTMLLGDPSPKERAEHREALTWMLRLTKLYHYAASDPQFPERTMEKEMRGRLIQLEHSWAVLCDNFMTDAEADKLLAETFPDEPGTGGPS